MTSGVHDADERGRLPGAGVGRSTYVHPYAWPPLDFWGSFIDMETPDCGIPEHLAARMNMAEQYEYLRTKLTRRRTLVTAGAMAAGGLLTGCGGKSTTDGKAAGGRTSSPATSKVPGAVVTPFGRHLAFGADPKTEMRISWQVPFAVRKRSEEHTSELQSLD